jgi:putative ABC transport system permease protein
METRIVEDVTLDVPGLEEPATGRLVSIPDRGQPLLNALHLRAGRFPTPGRRNEVLISESFAEANRLRIGDRLGAILNGHWNNLEIVGIALSPEYIYEIRGGGSIFPDRRRFGVLWTNRSSVAEFFDMEGAFNDVTFTLAPGARPNDVIAVLDRLLAPYGGRGANPRRDQLSHAYLSNELDELTAWGSMVPAIFLGVAAFLLHLLLTRLVATQREQIAVLKAFGYRNTELGFHYAKLVLAMIAGGAVLGVISGLWLGSGMTALYSEYFRFPVLRVTSPGTTCALAVLVSVIASLLGAASALAQVVALPPAVAMRPEAPPRFQAGWLERTGIMSRLAPPNRITARNLARRPLRTALSITGVALALMIVIVGRYFLDSVNALVDVVFREASREQVTLSFRDPRPGFVRYEIEHLRGVRRAEGFRAVAARLVAGARSRRTAILGMEQGTELRRLVNAKGRVQELPSDGLALTTHLANYLGIQPGDRLRVELLEGDRRIRDVTVTVLVDEPVGESAYMDLIALHHLLGESGTLSGAYLSVDSREAPALYAALKRMPAIGAVSIREVALQSFEETAGRTFGIFTGILVFFASLMAIAMVYNGARVSLSERSRELGSLRILGFSRQEAASMMLAEQGVTTALAIPWGIALGAAMCAIISRAYQSELFRLPLTISAISVTFAIGVVLASSALSALLIRRRVTQMDLISALKTRE